MAPSRLIIEPVGGEPITVMFNPNSYSVSKQISWDPSTKTTTANSTTDANADAPVTAFGGGASRVLSLDLFFDSTESDEQNRDVRRLTDRIARLTRIDPASGHPPVCKVTWGLIQSDDFPFTGTISSLTQEFVLFDRVGRALRANVKLAFTEFLDRKLDTQLTKPETTTRILRRGDTLASLAAEIYRDPSAWRVIAQANGIDNPLVLRAGSALTLPKR